MMLKTLNKILRRSVTFHKRNFCIEKNEKYPKERKLLRELCSKIRFRKKNIFADIVQIPSVKL